jgi:hypothetical protein
MSTADGQVGLLAAPAKALVSSGPRGFDMSGKVFPAEGSGGLSNFGDSLLVTRFFVYEAELISCSTLHGSLWINIQTIKENIEDNHTF